MSNLSDFGFWQGVTNFHRAICPVGFYSDAASPVTTVALDLSQAAPWVLAAARKLERLGTLQPGWDSYGGHPLKQRARESTVRAMNWLHREELPVPAVVLGSKGTVQLEWHAGTRELDVDLGEGEDIGFVKCLNDGGVVEGRTAQTADGLRSLVRWLVTA